MSLNCCVIVLLVGQEIGEYCKLPNTLHANVAV